MLRCSTSHPFYLQNAVENVDLKEEQKVYYMMRYMDLVRRYRKKYQRVNTMYNCLRITVMVGSIFIPALLTLQKDPTTIISETTYWVVFGLSLCVTLSNSLLELFNVAAMNTKLWLHVHRLETEGWQFLHLSDAYSKFETLQEAFPKFSSKVEKLHLSLVFDLLRLENKNKSVNSSSSNNNNNEAGTSFNGAGSTQNGSLRRSHLFGLPRDNESISTDQESKGSVNGAMNGSLEGREKPSLVLSLQEFQSQLDDSQKII